MRKLRPGLWYWTAPHPDWRDTEPWDENVSSYAIDDGGRLLLFDPMPLPIEIEALVADCETAVVLTCPWHERATESLVERFGVPVHAPLPDTAEYLMQTYSITAEQAGDGSPDIVWLFKEGRGDGRLYTAGDKLLGGIETYPGHKPNDLVLWIESQRAVIAGDTLADHGDGVQINERWLPRGVTREHVIDGLRPLLDLPVEHLLPTHGEPTDRAALERALA